METCVNVWRKEDRNLTITGGGHCRMKSYRKELWFNVSGRRDFINITLQVEECVQESAGY